MEVPEYPYEVIREAIVNAIAHRDYDFDNSFITFYIYTDRIEIISPGRLPYPLTIDQLGKTKKPYSQKSKNY
ncbi:ATP-binding protein [Methanosphaera sp. ISO3-F5]|nr:ATP-binding protein [Methanosphaera sp. ISO3-F5]